MIKFLDCFFSLVKKDISQEIHYISCVDY